MEAIPYLPVLFQEIVSNVDAALFSRPIDPFHVYFDYGIYTHVTEKIVAADQTTYPIVWLMMNFDEEIGRLPDSHYEAPALQLVIAMPTEKNWTMQERESNTFNPRLFPIYEELIKQISRTSRFGMPSIQKLAHRRTIRPYWGGGDANGPGAENLFKNYVDAIHIRNLRLTVKRKC
jgi:hypothetical protein